jgi:ketosteroid isomerase-like protein
MGALEEANKEIARRFVEEVLSRGDADAARELYAEDFEVWTAGTLPFSGSSNKAQALEGMSAVLGLFPKGLSFTVDAMTAEGGRVAIEAHSDGITAAGPRYQQTYHFLMELRDGRITRFKEYMDTELARRVLVEGREAD